MNDPFLGKSPEDGERSELLPDLGEKKHSADEQCFQSSSTVGDLDPSVVVSKGKERSAIAISKSQIMGIDQLSDIANRVFSFLNRDDVSLPVHDDDDDTSGDSTTVTENAFACLALLVDLIDTMTVKQIVQDGKWHEISLILHELRSEGFGGLYFQQLEADISAERENLERLVQANAQSNFMLMSSQIMQRVATMVEKRAEILHEEALSLQKTLDIAQEKLDKEQSSKKLIDII